MGRWAARRRLKLADKTVETYLQPHRVAEADQDTLMSVAELAALHVARSGLPFDQLQTDTLGFLVVAYVMGQLSEIRTGANGTTAGHGAADSAG